MPKYVIGVDLGTTNCALAYAEAGAEAVTLFPVAQLVNPGEVREEPLLPSFLYVAGPADFPAGSIALPWDKKAAFVAGVLAQKRGVESAGRLVASAKSWLCHAGVDRTAPILPLHAPEGTEKLSPVAASRRYLEHLRHAWDAKIPEAPFQEQQIIITVPASFDAVARELTERAAAEAGYRDVILLEEPQAAFYSWIENHPGWREQATAGDLILVIDIGGGTTDFTLIAVKEKAGDLELERVAVGEHILLGGDNMDLALARFLEQQLAAKNTKLDALQLNALWQQCRAAKENLLGEGPKQPEQPVTILGRGSGLVGGTIKTKLRRADVERLLLDGFFPVVKRTEAPQKQRISGLREIGLPYALDAAITRHLAGFLQQTGGRRPTHVLFNGGVLRARLVEQRIVETLNGWGADPVRVLGQNDLMHAVSRGAAYYGLARAGKGVRIRGGIPRTYYVGIESSMPAVPGLPTPLKALTVAPFGMEEGARVQIPGREFGLVVGEPAEFRFFHSATRRNDQPGTMIEEAGDDLEELAPVEVTLPASEEKFVAVTLETVVTETGVLQLWCVARDGGRWKLEFNVREKTGR